MRLPFWHDTRNRRDEFVTVARFLTRWPLAAVDDAEPVTLARGSWAFPVVGVVVGVVGGVVHAVAAALALPGLAAALLAVGACVLLTGGLHEDGLADTVDGIGGGADVAEKLAIMRDSRTGAFGVLALVFSVGLRAAALDAIAGNWAVLAALVAAHAVGRGGLPAVMHRVPAARSDGLGAAAGTPAAGEAAAAAGIAAVVALIVLGLGAGIAGLIAAVLVMAGIAWLARRQIGGHTGDVLGAIEQGGETAMLLAAASWAT